MEPEYEIQTMKKDIDKLAKKTAINEPPGASLPSEPMVSAPVELSKRSEPILPPVPSEDEESHRTKKVFIPIVLVIVILLIGAGAYYWWNYLRVFEPAGFLEVDGFEIIESLDINIPVDISRALGKKYTFFVYKQENRAGFMAEITEREILEAGLRDWEITMPENLGPIFLGQEIDEPTAGEFQNSLYKGVNIRYLNFADSGLAIDYAIVNGYFVVATSKNSMLGVIDGVLEK